MSTNRTAIPDETLEEMITLRNTGLSYDDIAKIYKRSFSTVRTSMHRYIARQQYNTVHSSTLYSAKAPDLDDTTLPRWHYMPPKVNISLMQRMVNHYAINGVEHDV